MVPFYYRYYNDLYSFTTIPNFPKENLKQRKKHLSVALSYSQLLRFLCHYKATLTLCAPSGD